TRGARLVLVDDTGTRAIMTAHWLTQMGWDAVVLDRAFDGRTLETGTAESRPALPDATTIGAAEAAHWLNEGDAAAVAIMPSSQYREAHPG
ncbi:MAG TPA: rhodanese-related sulfurtransferase, partial [Stellaceae bacterium]|nr:rhodanese-related sulfurtransferase [Stellaceae bacterium]